MAARGAVLTLVYSPSAQRKIAADSERFRERYCMLPKDEPMRDELNSTFKVVRAHPPRAYLWEPVGRNVINLHLCPYCATLRNSPASALRSVLRIPSTGFCRPA